MNPPAVDEKARWFPGTEEENTAVRNQLNRLLETNYFKHSQRYPALFRYIVEETLDGRGEYIKERLLGMHVFDRPSDYDTSLDPIVRVTMGEIRKRVAQYYQVDAHETELRIILTPGRYVPEFQLGRLSSATFAIAEEGAVVPRMAISGSILSPSEDMPSYDGRARSKRSPIWRRLALAFMVALILAVASRVMWQRRHPSAIDEFWGSVLAARGPVTLCLPSASVVPGYNIPAEAGILSQTGLLSRDNSVHTVVPKGYRDSTFLDHEIRGENMVFSDVQAMMKISNWMVQRGRDSRLRLTVSTTLDDMRQGPTVLIGGLNNEWTLRALAQLRFRFLGNYDDQFWVVDTRHPEKRDWKVNLSADYGSVTHDYALIARIHDQDTGQVEVLASGIGMSGTAAAGAFLVDPVQLEELRRRVGRGFGEQDFEAVLSMEVVNGIAGSAKIIEVDVR